ncbi:hypothetical protein [Aestuariicoccus sp. MJ-SS9]|uniref:hypothetical protein n=1 Tax=Aestuariicoccus sp. MJ-SS9 TaxID=3079855 RepID=UPI0029087915|nr:hypothetical protein [Aestuariicoccus sp. MJ-SS9]MDU8914205.1 hypothetical protein [Aestuariicoccus sp. MJ-SS9]
MNGLSVIEVWNLPNLNEIKVTSQAGERLTLEFINTELEIIGLKTEDFDAVDFVFL